MPPLDLVLAQPPAEEVDDAVGPQGVEVDEAGMGVAHDDVVRRQLRQRLAGVVRGLLVAVRAHLGVRVGGLFDALHEDAQLREVGARLLHGPEADVAMGGRHEPSQCVRESALASCGPAPSTCRESAGER